MVIQRRFTIDLQVGDRYQERLDGMCGDFNGDVLNDRNDETGARRNGHDWGNLFVYGVPSGNQGCEAPPYVPPPTPTDYSGECQCGSLQADNANGHFFSCLQRAKDVTGMAELFDGFHTDCPIRQFGFTTINEFDGELYYFNDRWTDKAWDIEKTSIVYDAATTEYNFYPDIATENTKRTSALNTDKTVLTYSDGTKWYRQGSAECNALLPFNIDIDDVYPAVTPRECGSEYKYHFDWIKQSLERLLNTKLVSGDVNLYLRAAITKMVTDFRAFIQRRFLLA